MLNLSPSKVDTELTAAAVSRAPAVSPPTAHRTEPTATVSRPPEPDHSSGIVASLKARLKAPLPAPSPSSAQMICGLQHVEPGCRHVVLNCDKHRVQPKIPAAVAMETEDHCPAAVVATEFQETSDDPVGAVLILSFSSFPVPAVPAVPAHSCYQRQSLMDTGGVPEPGYGGADWVRHPGKTTTTTSAAAAAAEAAEKDDQELFGLQSAEVVDEGRGEGEEEVSSAASNRSPVQVLSSTPKAGP
ncbi:uncharacterized protein LOC118496563 [Sander lucioperca]|uniref:uncharacterized protein LOC118496563 n=1 Tax=Sander lucioperca TaxID=283035 RepID=UPI0016534734|nr:uncharacterized protein LOC118496563 [Sander lucioperca]